MREIKFRAWDKINKKMVIVEKLILTENMGIWVNKHPSTGNLELMQFTGLKDKNGVEIYEGDILSDHPKTQKWRVYWSEDRWGLTDKKGVWDYDNGDFYRGDEINWKDFEVIGNIFENPELLTKTA